MKELICTICGDPFRLDFNDKDSEREVCRMCEIEILDENQII